MAAGEELCAPREAPHTPRQLPCEPVVEDEASVDGPWRRPPDPGTSRQLQALEAQLAGIASALEAGLEECAGQWRSCREALDAMAEGGWCAHAREGALNRCAADEEILEDFEDVGAEEEYNSCRRPSADAPAADAAPKEPSGGAPSQLPYGAGGGQSMFTAGNMPFVDENMMATLTSQRADEHSVGDESRSSASSDARPRPMDGTETERVKASLLHHISDVLSDPRTTPKLYAVVQSVWFNAAGVLLTVLNGVLVAIDTDMATTAAFREVAGVAPAADDDKVRQVFAIAQYAFLAWMAIEIGLRLVATRVKFFLGPDKFWNLFDLVILAGSVAASRSSNTSISCMRVFRVARATRAIQAMRLFRNNDSLRRMTERTASVMLSMFWAACFIFTCVYVVGIVMMEGVNAALAGPSEELAASVTRRADGMTRLQGLETYYSGVGRVWVTLFCAISGGDWSEFAAPLASSSSGWTALWIAYIFCVAFGILNVLTAAIVNIIKSPLPQDRLMALAMESKEEETLVKVFLAEMRREGMDADEVMTKGAFNRVLSRPRMQKQLLSLGVDVGRMEDLFNLVDPAGLGGVTAKMAARHALALRGEARSLDLIRTAAQVSKLRSDVVGLKRLLMQLGRRFKQQDAGSEGEEGSDD